MFLPDYVTAVKEPFTLAVPPVAVPVLTTTDIKKMSAVERAFAAADVWQGRLALLESTFVGVCARLNVSHTYGYAAMARTAGERTAILAGERPLILPNLDADWVVALIEQGVSAQRANGHSALDGHTTNGAANDNTAVAA
jgi:hypothetical protein